MRGGDTGLSGDLNRLDMNDPAGNRRRYSSWAQSVTHAPSVIKQKVCADLLKAVGSSRVYLHSENEIKLRWLNRDDCN